MTSVTLLGWDKEKSLKSHKTGHEEQVGPSMAMHFLSRHATTPHIVALHSFTLLLLCDSTSTGPMRPVEMHGDVQLGNICFTGSTAEHGKKFGLLYPLLPSQGTETRQRKSI